MSTLWEFWRDQQGIPNRLYDVAESNCNGLYFGLWRHVRRRIAAQPRLAYSRYCWLGGLPAGGSGHVLLHLFSKGKPGRSLQIMLFVLVMAAIVVGGSIWVMHNLNYRMMPGEQKVTETIQDKENIHHH